MIGRRLGSYEIVEKIGAGGMGTVYKARQPALQRTVALKVLPDKLAANRDFVLRFMREAKSIAALDHPGIVTVFDVGESDGIYYFAMQLLEGSALNAVIEKRGALPTKEAASVAAQVAEALGYAHAAGILHRDVKPHNVIVLPDGRAVLTDFGIAWATSDTRLTRAGGTVGSPQYMSPEQIGGGAVDQRSDLYSLGVAFFQALTGELPFKGDSALSVAQQHMRAPVPSASEINAAVPPEAARVATRLMAKKPEERYHSAGELLAELWPLAGGRPADATGKRLLFEKPPEEDTRQRRILLLSIGVVATALFLVIGLWLAFRSSKGRVAAGQSSSAATAGGQPELATSPATPDQLGLAAVAPPPLPRTFHVETQPSAATVRLDGTRLERPTPVTLDLLPGATYRLELELDGYETVERTFSLDELDESERSSSTLVFPLARAIPPGRLTIRASYPVEVRIGSQTYSGESIQLPPGRHRVTLSAPSVFYSTTRDIEVRSGAASEVALPAATSLTIAAAPSRCRIRIDGRDAGYVPAEVQVTLGLHEFEFVWESLGKSLTLRRQITPSTERVFAAAP